MEAFKLPLPAEWVEPVWFGVQILLILLAGYLAQRFVAKGLRSEEHTSELQH